MSYEFNCFTFIYLFFYILHIIDDILKKGRFF